MLKNPNTLRKNMADEFKTEGERLLFKRWPTAEDLRKEFPYMGDSLNGYFGLDSAMDKENMPKFNVYEQGRVVSRDLVQLEIPPKKHPTVGIILPGEYNFPTGNNTETLTVLDGELEACVSKGFYSLLRRDGTIVAPAGTTLNLRVDNATRSCFYICRYTPKTEIPAIRRNGSCCVLA